MYVIISEDLPRRGSFQESLLPRSNGSLDHPLLYKPSFSVKVFDVSKSQMTARGIGEVFVFVIMCLRGSINNMILEKYYRAYQEKIHCNILKNKLGTAFLMTSCPPSGRKSSRLTESQRIRASSAEYEVNFFPF